MPYISRRKSNKSIWFSLIFALDASFPWKSTRTVVDADEGVMTLYVYENRFYLEKVSELVSDSA